MYGSLAASSDSRQVRWTIIRELIGGDRLRGYLRSRWTLKYESRDWQIQFRWKNSGFASLRYLPLKGHCISFESKMFSSGSTEKPVDADVLTRK